MELLDLIGKIEIIIVRVFLLGGVALGSLTIFTFALFEYGQILKYLWRRLFIKS